LGVGLFIFRFNLINNIAFIDKYLFSIGIGFAIFTNTLFFLGLINQINALSVLLVFLSFLIISIISIKDELESIKSIKMRMITLNKLELIICVVLFILVSLNLIGALAPSTLADSMNHHLAAPKFFSQIGGFPFVPLNPWPMPGLVHVLFTKALILSNEISCQLIIFYFGILSTIALFNIISKYFDRGSGLIAALVYYSLPLTTELSTGAMPELATCFLLIMSVHAIINAIYENKDKINYKWILLGGLLGGCSGASKIWAMLGGPAAVVIIIYLCYIRSKSPISILSSIILYSFMYNIILLPWFLRNYFASGNPLWPLGFYIFDTKFWSEISVMKYGAWQRGPETSLINYFYGPWNLTTQIEKFAAGMGALSHYVINPLYLAFIPALITISKNFAEKKYLLNAFCLFSLVIYSIWYLGGYHHPRYFFLVYPFLSMVLGVSINEVLKIKFFPLKYLSRLVIVLSCTMIFVLSFVINLKYLPVFFGRISENQYLNDKVPHYSSIKWMNTNLPKKSKIMYVGSACWYYVDHSYIANEDRTFSFYKLKSSNELEKKIDSLGVTHVYIEGSQEYKNPTLMGIKSGNLAMTDFNLNQNADCDYWLNIDSNNPLFHNINYHQLRKYILLRGMELDGKINLIKLLKAKKIQSRIRGSFTEVEDAIYKIE